MAEQDNSQGQPARGRWSNEPVPESQPGVDAHAEHRQSRWQLLHALATHPVVVAVAAGLLGLMAVVGLSLEWARTTVSAGEGAGEESVMSFSVSGFGLIRGQFDAAGLQETWVDATFLAISTALIFLVMASALLIAFTALKRVGAAVTAAGGIGFIAFAVTGIATGLGVEDEFFSGDTAAMTEQDQAIVQALIDSLTTSTGPGVYVTLTAGVLLTLLGGYFTVRSGYAWFPRPQRPEPADPVATEAAAEAAAGADGDVRTS